MTTASDSAAMNHTAAAEALSRCHGLLRAARVQVQSAKQLLAGSDRHAADRDVAVALASAEALLSGAELLAGRAEQAQPVARQATAEPGPDAPRKAAAQVFGVIAAKAHTLIELIERIAEGDLLMADPAEDMARVIGALADEAGVACGGGAVHGYAAADWVYSSVDRVSLATLKASRTPAPVV